MEKELGQPGVWALHYLKADIDLETKATYNTFGLISKEAAVLRGGQTKIKEEMMADRTSKNGELLKLRKTLKSMKVLVKIILITNHD
jgi:hypothetical protein